MRWCARTATLTCANRTGYSIWFSKPSPAGCGQTSCPKPVCATLRESDQPCGYPFFAQVVETVLWLAVLHGYSHGLLRSRLLHQGRSWGWNCLRIYNAGIENFASHAGRQSCKVSHKDPPNIAPDAPTLTVMCPLLQAGVRRNDAIAAPVHEPGCMLMIWNRVQCTATPVALK